MIGRIIVPFRGEYAEAVLSDDGTWQAPQELFEFLDKCCADGDGSPAEGPWGLANLEKAAFLLNGTFLLWRGARTDPFRRDGQADVPHEAHFQAFKIPEDAIKVKNFPNLRQQDGYSCGAVALEAAARCFSVVGNGKGEKGCADDKWFKKKLGTTARDGTSPQSLIRLSKTLEMHPDEHHPMSNEQLRTCLANGMPVICCVQAWGDPKTYDADKSGHYIVAIGYDADHVYFEDPSLLGTRGYMTWEQLAERWHDIGRTPDEKFVRWGLALRKNPEKAEEIE